MKKKVYSGSPGSLRSADRIAILEVEKVCELCLEGIFVTTVLDVGTGSGLFAEAFALRNLDVTGIDSNPDMIKTASKMIPDAAFKEGTAEMLPFADKSFDMVFLGLVLHESDDPRLALAEAKRVARSRVAVQEWPYIDTPVGPPLAHRLQPEKIADLAKKAGFEKIETIHLNHFILYRMTIE